MNIVYVVLYNFLFHPLFIFSMFFLSIFNKKIRQGIIGRFESLYILKNYFSKNNLNSNIIWFHCSSLGEYMQAEPLIDSLKNREKSYTVLVSFFSPSGFVNVKNSNIDCKVYLPFDFPWTMNSLFEIVRPEFIILANNDLWYNFLKIAKDRGVKTYLIGAESKRFHNNKFLPSHYFYKPIYSFFTKIFTNSHEDSKCISSYLQNNKERIITTGNPRFDQVYNNSKKNNNVKIDNVKDREKILLLSSMHKEDRNMIISQLIGYLKQNVSTQAIWASHEPNNQENKYLSNIFKRNELSVSVVDSLSKVDSVKSRVIIINTVGILADLYWKVRLAYIGGGFSSGVHNLMEPAIAGVPTIFGPNYKKFKEAVEILNEGAGKTIKEGSGFKETVINYFNDDKILVKSSRSAVKIINSHIGATKKILNHILID